MDADFPESIGGSSITSNFSFSAPAGSDDLSKLSIVWSQTKDSDDADKYEIKAVRFYQDGDVIGVTGETDIAETDKNCTVDQFDTYTDGAGTVYALVLSSDYSRIDGLSIFDTIDMTNLPVVTEDQNSGENKDHLTILEQNPVTNIKLGSGTFPTTAIEAEADTNLNELTPGLSLPVQFSVKNTGSTTVNNVAVTLGGQSQTFTNLSLLPNQSAPLVMTYEVPEGAVSDTDYTITPDGDNGAAAAGNLILNRPDVGIAEMKLMREGDGERDIQVRLTNASGIPLNGSGKAVTARFKAEVKSFTVTVYNGESEEPTVTSYTESAVVKLKADTVSGKSFAYWTLDGEILSYNAGTSFRANSDCTAKAVYTIEAVEAIGTAVLRKSAYSVSTKKLVSNVYLTVPDGATITAAGLLAASPTVSSTKYTDTSAELTADNADYVKASTAAGSVSCSPPPASFSPSQ